MLLAALTGLGAGSAGAADLAPVPVKAPVSVQPPSPWDYQLTIYGWATALSGDVGVRNLPTTSIDTPFSDVLKNLDGALMGTFFADNGQWLFLADIVLAKLSHERSVGAFGGSDLRASVTEAVATGAVGYMLQTGRPDFDFAVTGGLRYMSVKGELSFDTYSALPDLSASQRQWWIDPTVGFFAHWQVNEKWFVNAVADIGGFGVGSKLSSTGYVGIGYLWTENFSTSLGYRYLYEDYEGPGAKTGTFRYNATMHGPTLALAWHF